jgi:hypothetical protein
VTPNCRPRPCRTRSPLERQLVGRLRPRDAPARPRVQRVCERARTGDAGKLPDRARTAGRQAGRPVAEHRKGIIRWLTSEARDDRTPGCDRQQAQKRLAPSLGPKSLGNGFAPTTTTRARAHAYQHEICVPVSPHWQESCAANTPVDGDDVRAGAHRALRSPVAQGYQRRRSQACSPASRSATSSSAPTDRAQANCAGLDRGCRASDRSSRVG